jgi:hypothetical protein
MASRTTKCRPVAILGVVSYYDSLRVNLGLFQPDLNVLRDLAPHDFSIMDYLAERNGVTLMVDHTYLFSRGRSEAERVASQRFICGD